MKVNIKTTRRVLAALAACMSIVPWAAGPAPSAELLLSTTGHSHGGHPHGGPARLFFQPKNHRAPDDPATIASGGPVVRHTSDRSLQAEEPGSVDLLRTGHTAFEPTIGFTPGGTLFFQGYGSPRVADQWDPTEGGLTFPILVRSTDEGASWEDVSPRTAGERTHQLSWDPYLYIDPDTSRVFTVDYQPGTCALVSRSVDDGETWTTGVGGCGLVDHQNVFGGPPVTSSMADYPNVIYYCSQAGGFSLFTAGAACQKSLDGGESFVPAGFPFIADPVKHDDGAAHVPGICGGAIGPGVVDRFGTVYIPAGQCGHPWLAISRDEGLTWTNVRVDVNSDIGMARDYRGPDSALTDGWFYSHESGVAADEDGNLYYTWVGRDHFVYLSVSTNGGETWGDPVRVSPPNVTDVSLPAIAAGSPGRVAIAYMGSENSPGAVDCSPVTGCEQTVDERFADVTWTGYVTVTDQALSPEPEFVTGAASPPDDPFVKGYCGQVRCGGTGDFFDVVIGPDGRAWAAFADDCLPDETQEAGLRCPAGPVFTSAIGVVAHLKAGPLLLTDSCVQPGQGPPPGRGPHECPPGREVR